MHHLKPIANTKKLTLVDAAMNKYLNSDDFVVKSSEIRPASDDMIGFLGEHWKIYVEYIFQDKLRNVVFFYKTLPRTNEHQKNYNVTYGFFKREIFFHGNVFDKYKKFDGLRQCIPKCYYSANDDLVFEDLHIRGFKMSELGNTMDVPHAKAVIKSLAAFHAGCFILEETKSVELGRIYRVQDEYRKQFGGGSFTKPKWYYKAVDEGLKLAATSLKYGKETPHFAKVLTKWDDVANRAIELLIKPANEPRNTILHCDLWNNNMMFKYDENNRPIQSMFVDYQCCKISKPAADIAAFLYLCLDKKTRDSHYEDFLNLYFDELTRILTESKINIANVMSLTDLRLSFEEYRLWGLVQSMVLFQFLFLEDSVKQLMATDSKTFDKLANHDRNEEILNSLNANDGYRSRLIGNIEELIERYII